MPLPSAKKNLCIGDAGGMKAIGLTSTYAAAALSEADWVVGKLAQIQVSVDEAGELAVTVA